jgi:hypothetical protein
MEKIPYNRLVGETWGPENRYHFAAVNRASFEQPR